MKQKLVVIIASVLMLALTVSAVSAEDSLNSTIDSISLDEGNRLTTSDTTSLYQDAISAKVPAALLDDIDKKVDSLDYIDNWGISKDQFKIMLAVLAWGEGGVGKSCRYAAHSTDSVDMWHRDLPNSFHFSSGLGPFQITATDKWTTIDKLNSTKALDDTIMRHKTYSKDSFENLEDVRSKLKGQWFAYCLSSENNGEFEKKWKEATGTNWDDVKYTDKETTSSPLDWEVIKKELRNEGEVESREVEDIGMRKWTISKEDNVENYEGNRIELNEDLPTWLIHAKKLPEVNKATSYEYYYTYDKDQNIEILAYCNASDTQHHKKSIFIRTYNKPGGWNAQRCPDNDGFTLKEQVFTDSSISTNANVILVIDRSGSMAGEPISNAKNSAQQFIDLMESEDKAGVVSFSSSARTDYPLTILTDDEKKLIKEKINSISASGSTAIGSGLKLGLSELVNNGAPNTPKAIVLLSDGKQNAGEHPDNVIPSIKASNIQVYTIGLGYSVDEDLLNNIATETDGMYFYAPSESQLNQIYNDIVAKILDLDTAKKLTVNMVIDDVVSVPVKIDSTVERSSFSISWPGSNVDLILYKPDGSMVDSSVAGSDPNIEYLTGSTYKIYKVTNPEPGEWTMELTATDMPVGGEDVYVTVRAKSTLSMLLSTDKDQYKQGESVKIVADLSDAGAQIKEADVEANITLPDSSIEHLILYDDGSHGDGEAQDGVYANFFMNTLLQGDYRIDATSTGSLSDGSQFNRIEDISFEIIPGSPIIVEAGSDQTVEEGASVNFEGSFTASGSHTYFYHWDFGDGSVEEGSLTASHIYADDDAYTVNLTVTDEDGDFGTDTLLITVNNVIPVVGSGSDLEVTAGDLVPFSGTFSDPGWLDTHTAEWNFGEGTAEAGSVSEENEPPNSTGTVPGNFSYFDSGEYTVVLNVTDDDGGIGQDQLTVTVLPIVATVDFDPDTLNLGSGGKWVTAYIELPDRYNAAGINASSVFLNDTVSAVTDPKYGFVTDESEYLKDVDGDGIPDRMFKFDREEVEAILEAGDEVTVTFKGKVEYDNGIDSGMASFKGSDLITVIESDNKKDKSNK